MTQRTAHTNVLVVGSGGREHALAWKIAQSNKVGRVFVAPGNGGTTDWNVDISVDKIDRLADFAAEHRCFTVVGPELPLSLGISDLFEERGLDIFAPSKSQARIETSKAYAKRFMVENGIPTAEFSVFSESESAIDYARERAGKVVVKADGLAGGKGVVVCSSVGEAKKAIVSIMDERLFGEAGRRVIVEEKLEGSEVSFFAICDGNYSMPFATATDHKRLLDGDIGPNTGGMGAYSPTPAIDSDDSDRIMKLVIESVVVKIKYRGFLFAGLMMTDDGPRVLEFNARLGDPEAQAILPRLKSDFLEVLLAANSGFGRDPVKPSLEWRNDSSCSVVMCSAGYPSKPRWGAEIYGVEQFAGSSDTLIFHSATDRVDGFLRTSGGRVLSVTSLGETLDAARDKAYSAVRQISWNGEYHRNDIAANRPHESVLSAKF